MCAQCMCTFQVGEREHKKKSAISVWSGNRKGSDRFTMSVSVALINESSAISASDPWRPTLVINSKHLLGGYGQVPLLDGHCPSLSYSAAVFAEEMNS